MKTFRRLISLALLAATLLTSSAEAVLWTTIAAAETAEQTSGSETAAEGKTSVYYMTNGGTLREGLSISQTVDSGAVLVHPGSADISRPGYTFGGWYTNRNLDGEKTGSSVITGTEEEETVFYAKWIERNYYVTIPATVSAEGSSKINIASDCYGFYENDTIDVSAFGPDGSADYSLSETAGTAAEGESTSVSLGENENKDIYINGKTGNTGTVTFGFSFKSTQYTVTYETNGGKEIEKQSVDAGTEIGELPATEKTGYVFVGWCYDSGCTQLAESTDEINGDCTLYASYITMEAEDSDESAAMYCHASEVKSDYTVKIGAKTAKTVAEVEKALTVINANDPRLTDFYTITLSDGVYLVNGKDGWEEGANYRFIIDTDVLYFADFVTEGGEDPDELDMTVAKDEVNNFSVRDSIIFVPFSSISALKVNGISPANPVLSDVIAHDSSSGSVTTNGSFVYSGKLSVGDIVGIYTGNKPTYSDSELITTESTCKYIEITSVSGNTYSYRGASTEDVIFTPDVFPVPLSADTDGVEDDSIRAAEKYFIYKDGSMEALGLTVDTTVDAGDFIAFYYGTLENSTIKSYARIVGVKTDVAKDGVYFVIDYVPVTLEEMKAACETYVKREYTDEEYSEIVKERKDDLEQEVLEKSIESGLVEKSAKKLAAALIETDGFRSKLEAASIDPDKLNIVYSNGFGSAEFKTVAATDEESTVEVSIKSITPYLDSTLVYFEGKKGLRLTLDVTVEITVHGKEADIKFTVTGSFQQEVRITVGADSDLVWDDWHGIPYISDLRISVTTDIYEYTGMEIKVTVTVEGEDELEFGPVSIGFGGSAKKVFDKAKDIVEKIESIAESGSKILGTEDDELIATQLAEIYARMLDEAEEAEWVDVLTVNIYGAKISIYDVAEMDYSVDFIVSAKMNLTAGANFYFATGKRYIFNLDVFEGSISRETVDLEPEVFEFSFYAVGTAGIRAGIQIAFDIGLVSTELDSIGFKVRLGAFIEAHGYYYYNYKRVKENGVTTTESSSSGAVYFEVGIFLKLDFITQVSGGLIEVDVEALDEQWTLLTMGEVECVQSFVDQEYDELLMKHAYKRAYLPDETFMVEYLDLLEGADVTYKSDGTKEYSFFTKGIEISDLDVTFTNDKFSYDYTYGCVEVTPAEGDRCLDGELVITYRGELAFSRDPIQIRIPLHWDNLADGYLMAYETNGGSYINPVSYRYGAKVTQPADPTRPGYRFTGWYSDPECTKAYTFPETMPAETTVVYAGWEYGTVEYKVEHYRQNLSGVYELYETDVLTGRNKATVTPERKSYEGFEAPAAQTVTLSFDSSTTVKYYYSRNSYSIVFKYSDSDTDPIVRYLRYGAVLTAPSFGQKGYVFGGWDKTVPATVPAGDMTFVATFTPATDTAYKVCTYLQNADGIGYTLASTEIKTGTTDTAVNVSAAEISGYHAVESSVSGTIAADGSTKLCLYYDRNVYKVTYDTSNGSNGSGTACPAESYRFGAQVFLPASTLKDYALIGWYTDAAGTKEFDGIMPEYDITLYAKWEKGTGYLIEHYLMSLDGTYPSTANESEYLYLQAGQTASITREASSFEGFTSPAAQTFSVNSDGSTVVKFYYSRNKYTLSIEINGVEANYLFYYGQTVSVQEPVMTGYTFTGFSPALPDKMPASHVGTNAEFKVNSYKITYKLDYDSKEASATYDYGSAITAYTPSERTGYTFAGWKEGTEAQTMPAEDLVYTAQWTPVEYSITYNLNDDSTDKATNGNTKTTYTCEEAVSFTNPTRPNYDFAGWTVEGKTYTTSYSIPKGTTGNKVLTATWKAKEIRISFTNNKDVAITNADYSLSVVATYGQALPDITVPASNEYSFGGYTYTNPLTKKTETLYDANGKSQAGTWKYTSGNLTATGVWTVKRYKIAYHCNDSVVYQEVPYVISSSDSVTYTIMSPSSTPSGKLFLGWTTTDGSRNSEFKAGDVIDNIMDLDYDGTVDLYAILLTTTYASGNILLSGTNTWYNNMQKNNYVNEHGKGQTAGADGAYALNGLYVNDDVDYKTCATITIPDTLDTTLYRNSAHNYTSKDGSTYKDTGINSSDTQVFYSTITYKLGQGELSREELMKHMSKCTVKVAVTWTQLHNGWFNMKAAVNGTVMKTFEKTIESEAGSYTFSFEAGTANISKLDIYFDADGDDEDCYIVNSIYVTLTYHN